MDLAPGPFTQGNPGEVDPGYFNYDFTADANTLSNQLLALSADWDSFVADLVVFAAGPADPTFGVDDLGILNEIGNEIAIAEFPELTQLGDDLGLASTLLGAAISFAPAAAWSSPTLPYVPPDPTATIVVPTIPISEFTPNVTGLVGTPSSVTLPAVTLSNLTRVGSTNFVVGDTFEVTASGPPNVPVNVWGKQNGVDGGQITLGYTDGNGNFDYQGVMSPDAVGQWLENWYVGGLLVLTVQFMVAPGS